MRGSTRAYITKGVIRIRRFIRKTNRAKGRPRKVDQWVPPLLSAVDAEKATFSELASGRWLGHHFAELIAATGRCQVAQRDPSLLENALEGHVVWRGDEMPITILNPGWEASIHCFRLSPEAVRRINAAVIEESQRLERDEVGLKGYSPLT